MPQHIGNAGTKARAWVEDIILSPSPQVKRVKKLEEFAKRLRSPFDSGESLDVTTRRLMETFFGYSLEGVRIHRGLGVEEASRSLNARAFTVRGHIFAPQQNLDTSTSEGLGLLAHELTHVIQQTQPHRLPQGGLEGKGGFSQPEVAPPGGHSSARMVLLAKNAPSTTSPQLGEAQARASEQLVADGLSNNTKSTPHIDHEEVANKVYRLMQCDLCLEGERAT